MTSSSSSTLYDIAVCGRSSWSAGSQAHNPDITSVYDTNDKTGCHWMLCASLDLQSGEDGIKGFGQLVRLRTTRFILVIRLEWLQVLS